VDWQRKRRETCSHRRGPPELGSDAA
jgi:hypothetical protein